MSEKNISRAQEIAVEIKDRRMVFTDQDWSDDTEHGFDKVYAYVYFIFAGTPVRVHRHPELKWAGAEKLNYRTGKFEEDNYLLIPIEDNSSGDAEEISKEEFYKKCDEYMAHWTPDKIAELDVMKKKNEAWLRERIAMKEGETDGK